MHLGSTVHNQPCQPKPSGDWPQEGKTLRKEGKKKKKNQLNLCDFGLCAGQSPRPHSTAWGCTPPKSPPSAWECPPTPAVATQHRWGRSPP